MMTPSIAVWRRPCSRSSAGRSRRSTMVHGGLLALAAHCPDLVLLDISMPGMTGIEVCQRIRADHALAGLRVIAYTAHALREQQERFLASGFDDVLVKPISFRAVQELLMAQT